MGESWVTADLFLKGTMMFQSLISLVFLAMRYTAGAHTWLATHYYRPQKSRISYGLERPKLTQNNPLLFIVSGFCYSTGKLENTLRACTIENLRYF